MVIFIHDDKRISTESSAYSNTEWLQPDPWGIPIGLLTNTTLGGMYNKH